MNKLIKFCLLLSLFSWLFVITVNAFEFKRRQEQFSSTPGYLVLPAPYEFPGVGSGMMLIGYAGNMFGTPIDTQVLAFNGDVEGYYGAIKDIYIVPKFFFLSGTRVDIRKYAINIYESRGMDTEKDEFNISVGEKYLENSITATLTLFDRRLEFAYMSADADGRVVEIRDNEDELVTEFADPIEAEERSTKSSVLIDLTDDYSDPLSGIRFRGSTTYHPKINDDDPEYNVLTYGITYYVPVFDSSTWVFHFSRSDASVIEEGNTDLESLLAETAYSLCSQEADQSACESAILDDTQNTINANNNGTADSLGGVSRLRSYPINRYQGAHNAFYGTELRLNLNTKKSDFNLLFISDVMQALQLAFFYEQGSVSEKIGDLGNIRKNSYGAGLRIVAASGNVYRFEFATGDEGGQSLLFFQYPWD